MKLNRLETHDRLEHFVEDQAHNIWKGADDCMKRNSLSLALQDKSPYIYIFAHPRTAEDGVTKVMYWQPRLVKPEAQTNSYLFRATSKSDLLEIMWLIPPPEMWNQYKQGNVTEHPIVTWSINQFRFNRKELEKKDKDDLPEERIKQIYLEIASNNRKAKPMISEVFSSLQE
jgi:hypothetical protein